MKRSSLLFALTALGLAGCGLSSVRPVIFNPDYAAAKVDGRTVQVLPIRDLHVLNKDDVDDDFKDSGAAKIENPELIFAGLMRDGLVRFADHAKSEAIPMYHADTIAYRDTVLTIPADRKPMRTAFKFPAREALEAAGIKPDLGLQLDHLWVRRDREQGGPLWVSSPSVGGGAPTMKMAPGGNAESLQVKGIFILWDYRANALVACGHFEVNAALVFGMRKSTWEDAFGAIAREVVEGTPLQGGKLAQHNYRPQNDPLRR